MLHNIAAEDQAYALTLLRWLAYSQTPLNLDQVAEISTIVPGENPAADDIVDINNRGGLTDALDILAGLVVTFEAEAGNGNAATDNSSLGDISKGDDDVNDFSRRPIEKDTKIRLAHFSVKEYLESTRIKGSVAQNFHLDPAREHWWITQSCLVYLMHYSTSEQRASSQQDLVVFPLLEYAAAMWYRHALLQQAEDHRYEIQLLESKTHRAYWLKIHKPDMSWERPFDNEDYDDEASSLYYASFIGRVGVVQLLLEAEADVNAQGGYYGTALQAASFGGYEKVVQLLLEAEADVNAQGRVYGTALQAASSSGHEKVVQLLLEAKADVNAQGGWYGTALQAASSGGHEKVVQLLLEAEADVNAQGGHFSTALQAASSEGHEKVVQLLLEAKADVNAQGGQFSTALQGACSQGHEKIVQLLLEAKADVNAQGGRFGTALYAASSEGHEKVVQLLLKAEADVDAQGGHYGTALQVASSRGYETVVQLLLEAKADVNAQGGHYGTALQAASFHGHEEVVQMLLLAGAVDKVGED
jgi:ankyrin repeat protein